MQRIQVNFVKALGIRLLLDTPRQVDQRRLARAIARAPGDHHCACPRRNVDHTSAALRTKCRHKQPHQAVRPVEVDGHVVQEILGILLVHGREHVGASIVHQNVDAAIGRFQDLVNELLTRRQLRDVALHKVNIGGAQVAATGLERSGWRRAVVHEKETAACDGKALRVALADGACGTGDDGDAVLKTAKEFGRVNERVDLVVDADTGSLCMFRFVSHCEVSVL
jgi:hypothetical protein